MLQRVLIDRPPFTAPPLLSRAPWDPPAQWPARWLTPPVGWETPLVLAFRLVLDSPVALAARLHVSADERYELWCDGERVGGGPERGDEWHWAFESWDLRLAPGRHVLTARVWAFGRLAPWAQRSLGAGFLCAAEGDHAVRFATGQAPWQVRRLDGWSFADPSAAAGTGVGTGPSEQWDSAAWWDPADAAGDPAWVEPKAGEPGNNGDHVLLSPRRLLEPARLAPQAEAPLTGLVVAAADGQAGSACWTGPGSDAGWSALLAGQALTIPAGGRRRVLIDLGTYACGRPLVQAAGQGRITLAVGEALSAEGRKGGRDAIAGKRLAVEADALVVARPCRWQPLWWRAGRWLEVVAEAGAAPLRLEALGFTTTGYPWAVTGGSLGSDAGTAAIHAACERTWRACAHETFMDCPHYEQLMYVGDTRVQALLSYVLSADDALPRKALALFDSGRAVGRGLVPDAYPAGCSKLIPPFALWWVAMVHDHAWWRGGATAAHLPGVRAVCQRFRGECGADGLWRSSAHWNYLDWCGGWTHGVPPGGDEGGINASFNWQLVHALGQWAELEDAGGEPEQAALARRWRAETLAGLRARCWDAARGAFAEQPGGAVFSEHAQALALLSGALDDGERAGVGAALTGGALVAASCYFSHYLFDALAALERSDLLLARLEAWKASLALGLRTTPEGFGGEIRSDCHAWSAHPLYHHLATLLGVRPAAAGFARVRIAPRPGPLERIEGRVAHPRGTIHVLVERRGAGITATVDLPAGLSGELVWAGRSLPLVAGRQVVVAEAPQ
jgi:alpha-L-rhamnosidase